MWDNSISKERQFCALTEIKDVINIDTFVCTSQRQLKLLLLSQSKWQTAYQEKHTDCLDATQTPTLTTSIGVDSAGVTGNFALVLSEEQGQTTHFAPIPIRGLFWFLKYKCITLFTFTKWSPFNWLIPIISHFKVLDDGTVLCIHL